MNGAIKAGTVLPVTVTGTPQTLYAAITAAGIPVDSHESDLYFPVTDESTKLLARFPMWARNATRFQSKVDGAPARIELQDVLIDLRGKAAKEWTGATDQDVQDFFEHLARNTTGEPMSEGAARHLADIEGWSAGHLLRPGTHGIGDPCIPGCPACANGRASGYRGRW